MSTWTDVRRRVLAEAARHDPQPCEVVFVVRPGETRIPCRRPAEWRAIKTCPRGHEETVLRCDPCHSAAAGGNVICSSCQPDDVQVVTVAAESLH